MAEKLTLMAVHAHPDDESSSTGGVLATCSGQGIRTVVVTCTNGEFGDAPGGVKPGEDGHDAQAVAQLRLAELRQACKILGVTDLETLGYHDSGMPDWDYKERPEAFCNVPRAGDRPGQRADRAVPAAGGGQLRRRGAVSAPRPRARGPGRRGCCGRHRHPGQVLPHRDAAQLLAEDLGRAAGSWARTCRARARSPTRCGRRWRPPSGGSPPRSTSGRCSAASGTRCSPTPARSRTRGSARSRPGSRRRTVTGVETFIRASDSTGTPLPEDDLFAGLRPPA